jgi:hypothetical protein
MSTELISALIGAVVSGVASSLVTVIALKRDFQWLRVQVRDHENRLRRVERGSRDVSELGELGS